MEIITLTCKVISPMFIGNAYKKNVELRPTTLIGSLRYWWRAVHPNLNADELIKQEAIYFEGFSDKTEFTKRSFRILEINYKTNNIAKEHLDLRPEKQYYYINDNKREISKIDCLKSNTIFDIKLQILNNKEKVLALFKLASALGSLGKRSRRGAGVWKIESIDDDTNITYSVENIKTWITTINPKYKNNTNTPNYPYLKEFTIGENTYTNTNELRLKIMNTAHYCKKKSQHRNSFDSCLGKAMRNSRLASPVFVSMVEVENGVKPIISILNYKECKNNAIQKEFIKCISTNTNCK